MMWTVSSRPRRTPWPRDQSNRTRITKEKSDIHLIAEPWSFRGHIAKTLDTVIHLGMMVFENSPIDMFRSGSSKELAYYLGGSSEDSQLFPRKH